MTTTWNDHADGWDDDPNVKLYADQAFASLISLTDIRSSAWQTKRVLDFGCGTGLLAERVAPHVGELIAVDTSEKMIAVLKAKTIPHVTAVHAEILAPDHQSDVDLEAGFDLIYASSVCAFLPDYTGAVAAFAKLLKGGGTFVQWDWQGIDGDAFGLTEGRMRQALKAAGLASVHVRPAFAVEADGQSLTALVGMGVV